MKCDCKSLELKYTSIGIRGFNCFYVTLGRCESSQVTVQLQARSSEQATHATAGGLATAT